MLCVDKSRFANSALCFQTCCAMGSRNSSVSKAGPEVVLKAPAIVLAALACSPLRMSMVFRVYPSPVSFAIDHTEQPYVICGTTTAW